MRLEMDACGGCVLNCVEIAVCLEMDVCGRDAYVCRYLHASTHTNPSTLVSMLV